MDIKQLELSPAELRNRCDPSQFAFQTTADLAPLDAVIGQDRALRSIDFGVEIPSFGYNMFVVGPAGSGRTTTVKHYLNRRAGKRPVPRDWCYVYNFDDPRRPRAVSMPPGRASKLAEGMSGIVQSLEREIPRAFEGEYFETRRREIQLEIQQKQQMLLQELEKQLNERGFALIRSQAGLGIVPMKDGEVLSPEDFEKLDADTKKSYEAHRPELQEQYDRTMRGTRELDRQARTAIENVTNEMVGVVVDNLMVELKESFADCDAVLTYLAAIRADIVKHPDLFLPQQDQGPAGLLGGRPQDGNPLRRYEVNILAEACGEDICAPVIIEDNPTYQNLIGRIEHRAEFGAMITDFTQIHAGALHRANGGYLVIEAQNLLTNALSWEGLKRAIRNQHIKIEEVAQFYGMLSTASLEPEPIPLDVKVVIIGDERAFEILQTYDQDFRELFKVKAQFATQMPRTDETALAYARFVGDLCHQEDLLHFTPSAVAEVYEEASSMVADREKVTTHFAGIADLVRESSFWAARAGHEAVIDEDVQQAVHEREHRQSYTAERYRESIQEGVVLIDIEGAVVGQINGLSVIQMASYMFGLPSRITAQVYAGRAGVASIDREVKMSGPTHDKGQLILSSYLASRFAQQAPLAISATLTFEQNYGGVDGDSASSTELYALLSALSGIPIKQSLAVTGSVNQRGQIQAIGGVNAKIQGYFDICRERGLSGDQGVLIPISNKRHLMLGQEIIDAVENGQFHIYCVSTIEEGIELLTGVPAGEANAEGEYPEDTVYARVQACLAKYAEWAKDQDTDDDKAEEDDIGKLASPEGLGPDEDDQAEG